MKNTILPVQPSLILRTDNYQRLDSDLDGISHYYRYCVKDGKGKEFHAVRMEVQIFFLRSVSMVSIPIWVERFCR